MGSNSAVQPISVPPLVCGAKGSLCLSLVVSSTKRTTPTGLHFLVVPNPCPTNGVPLARDAMVVWGLVKQNSEPDTPTYAQQVWPLEDSKVSWESCPWLPMGAPDLWHIHSALIVAPPVNPGLALQESGAWDNANNVGLAVE